MEPAILKETCSTWNPLSAERVLFHVEQSSPETPSLEPLFIKCLLPTFSLPLLFSSFTCQLVCTTNLMFHVERKCEKFAPEGIVSRETTCKKIPALLDSRWRGIIGSNHRDRKSKG